MTKTMHSTVSRHAEAAPNFTDPTTLPDEYAMRVRGDCLAPAIKAGDAVLFDKRQPYKAGDLVGVYLKPGCYGGSTNVGLKRLVMGLMPGTTLPYKAHPESSVMPVLVCEQDNPHRQYTIPADQLLAVHRCLGLVPDGVALYEPETGEPQYKRAISAGWSRRDLLAGAAAIVPAGALVTLPALASDADAALFALEPVFNDATARLEAAMDAQEEAEGRHSAALPPMPDTRTMPHDAEVMFKALPISALGSLPDFHPISVWFREGNKASQAWQAECDRLRVETGLKAAEDAVYERMTEVDDVMREILAIPAMTAEGLLLKLRVAEAADCEPDDLVPAITADIEAMAGGKAVAS